MKNLLFRIAGKTASIILFAAAFMALPVLTPTADAGTQPTVLTPAEAIAAVAGKELKCNGGRVHFAVGEAEDDGTRVPMVINNSINDGFAITSGRLTNFAGDRERTLQWTNAERTRLKMTSTGQPDMNCRVAASSSDKQRSG